jgi:prepilin-type N-terminal cleavage/methylation domain-containing protein
MEVNKKRGVFFMKRIIRRSYTLVELLVVILIMGILMGIGLPAFNSLTKGQAVDAGSRQVSSMLKMARAYAISKTEYVAVIFPQAKETTGSIEDYNFGRFRACVVNYDSTDANAQDFREWVPGTKWEQLPVGVGVQVNPSGGTTYQAWDVDSVVDNAINGSTAFSIDDAAIIFRPSGSALGSKTYHLRLQQGTLSGGSFSNAQNASNKRDIKINPFTGRIYFSEDTDETENDI